jgi:hypothetical protein
MHNGTQCRWCFVSGIMRMMGVVCVSDVCSQSFCTCTAFDWQKGWAPRVAGEKRVQRRANRGWVDEPMVFGLFAQSQLTPSTQSPATQTIDGVEDTLAATQPPEE